MDNNVIRKASAFNVPEWVDAMGNKTEEIKLSDFEGKFKVVFCFQSWCPGCHSVGFPSLKKMVEALQNHKQIVFVAVQTVFEGFQENTFEKMLENQKKYNLKIPFGHDPGTTEHPGSNFMKNYQTGGTPWFVFIDQKDNIVFSDFHLNTEAAIDFLKSIQ